jgi:hypothetical protein
MREVRVGELTGVSTLLDAHEVDKRELVAPYGQRWHIELDFRAIKTVTQMDVLRGKSPEMVRKQVAVHLQGYNLGPTVMALAACLAHLLPRRLSFKATRQMLNALEENLRFWPRARLITRQAIVLACIAQLVLPLRPHRVEPRAVERRPKTHSLMTEPRRLCQRRMRKQQQRLSQRALR